MFPQVFFGNRERIDYQAQDGKEAKELPYLSIWRSTAKPVIQQFGTDAMQRFQGALQPGQTLVRNVPVRLEYQIDIVSDKRAEVDEIWRELYFYMIDDPRLRVDFGGDVGVHDFYLHWEDIEELTDTVERERVGNLYHISIDATVPQAQLFMERDYFKVAQVPVDVSGGVKTRS